MSLALSTMPISSSMPINTMDRDYYHHRSAAVLRRGQPFFMAVRMKDRNFDPRRDILRVIFNFGLTEIKLRLDFLSRLTSFLTFRPQSSSYKGNQSGPAFPHDPKGIQPSPAEVGHPPAPTGRIQHHFPSGQNCVRCVKTLERCIFFLSFVLRCTSQPTPLLAFGVSTSRPPRRHRELELTNSASRMTSTSFSIRSVEVHFLMMCL